MTMKVVYNVINGIVAAENRGGVRSRYVGNAVGSTMALLNTSQAVSDSWSYMPYGETTRITGTTATKLLYVGGASCRQDNSTNTLMGRRVLDVVKARWKTQDPIGFGGGDWNLSRYVGGGPVTNIDPSGLDVCSCGCNRNVGKAKGQCSCLTCKYNCAKGQPVMSKGHFQLQNPYRAKPWFGPNIVIPRSPIWVAPQFIGCKYTCTAVAGQPQCQQTLSQFVSLPYPGLTAQCLAMGIIVQE
jgi:RHS repeat-associated protein